MMTACSVMLYEERELSPRSSHKSRDKTVKYDKRRNPIEIIFGRSAH